MSTEYLYNRDSLKELINFINMAKYCITSIGNSKLTMETIKVDNNILISIFIDGINIIISEHEYYFITQMISKEILNNSQ